MKNFVHHIPIASTVLCFAFSAIMLRRYFSRGLSPHLLWWTVGIFIFGAGTFTEAWTTVFGWSAPMFRSWYISGALLGGAIYSAMRYQARGGAPAKMWGNVIIAIGAILPGTGGSFTRAGYVEVLYVTEFIGIILVYTGYRLNARTRVGPPSTAFSPQDAVVSNAAAR